MALTKVPVFSTGIPKINKPVKSLRIIPRSYVFKDPAFPLGIKEIFSGQGPGDYHVHENFSELVIIRKGHAVHVIDDLEYPIGPGDIFVILGSRVHCYDKINDLEYSNILFDFEQLKLPLYDLVSCVGFQVLFRIDPQSATRDRFANRFRLSQKQLTQVVQMVSRMAELLHHQPTGYRFRALSLFMNLITDISLACESVSDELTQNSTAQRIGELIGYLERNYSHPIQIEEMCRRVKMSRSVFFREFKKIFRESPLDYLINIRIKRASEMLLHSDKMMPEIAAECGFSDGNYLARKFRSTTGYTPSEFRHLFTPKTILANGINSRAPFPDSHGR